MNWADEPYVRVYTRDMPAFVRRVSWRARCLFWELMRKADRSGVIELGDDDPSAVASIIPGAMNDGEEVGALIQELVKDGCLILRDGCLIIRNFVDAQTTRQNDRLRQQQSRASRRDEKLAGDTRPQPPDKPRGSGRSHQTPPPVTTGHQQSPVSPGVTDGHSSLASLSSCADLLPLTPKGGGEGANQPGRSPNRARKPSRHR